MWTLINVAIWRHSAIMNYMIPMDLLCVGAVGGTQSRLNPCPAIRLQLCLQVTTRLCGFLHSGQRRAHSSGQKKTHCASIIVTSLGRHGV